MAKPLRAANILLDVIERLDQDPEGEWLLALRTQLTELAAFDDANAREAARLWLAGLGALSRVMLSDSPDAEEMALKCTELLARGTEAWIAYLEAAPERTTGVRRDSPGFEAFRAMGSMATAARQVVGGDDAAIEDVWRRSEEVRSWLTALRSDGDTP